ncbi:permease [Gracilibacillus salinarum]|uniref:Permease n=1 Tax=Gracilibacillus salinarum TaxID=2932255 RepID=A0ABY4GLL6_9BACI|nr:permease [Gracilibacillus salinarum]UOQ84845.1 permease [Gracilibacillus salinarum]
MGSFRNTITDVTGLFLFGCCVCILQISSTFKGVFTLPDSIYNLNTIFLSILIEALPFVLIGVLIAGGIQIFITEDYIKRLIPKNKFLAIVMSCVVGACFPACECGIVPIVRRLITKGVPIYAGIGFLLTGPLINPIVILSTFMAFGNDLNIAISRMMIGFVIAIVIATVISVLFKSNQLKQTSTHNAGCSHHVEKTSTSIIEKCTNVFLHAVDEFFDMGKYLIMGALVAAFVQTYISSEALVALGDGQAISSTAVMMGLAYFLSLCSEADAFIGASFRNLFPTSAILAFLIYGPMIDLKNTFMLLSTFKARFVFIFLGIVTFTVFLTMLLLSGLY